MPAREPEEIFEETRKEGRRRLSRPLLETATTALIGGFDVAIGITAYVLTYAQVAPRFGEDVAHLAGALAFGIGFVFVVVGRSELFTENFLVPVAGLDRNSGRSYAKLGEIWVAALALNVVGGAVMAIILTSHDVLRPGSGAAASSLAEHVGGLSPLASFLSALVAGSLMTVMTWFVEGSATSMGVRIVMAWIVGAVMVLGSFNHAIVSQIEIIFGMRYGADIGLGDFFVNLGLSVGGNLAGGLAFVTFTRAVQATANGGAK